MAQSAYQLQQAIFIFDKLKEYGKNNWVESYWDKLNFPPKDDVGSIEFFPINTKDYNHFKLNVERLEKMFIMEDIAYKNK